MGAAETVEVYTDAAGEHRWRAKAANGEIVADSGEGYEHRQHAFAMAREVFPDTPIVEVDEKP